MLLIKLPQFTRKPVFAWSVLIFFLLVTFSVAAGLANTARHAANNEIRIAASQIAVKVEERLQAYAVILRSVAGLFQVTDEVDRNQWRLYTDQLRSEATLTNIQGIGLSLIVAPDDLDNHQASVRAEGFSDYQISPPGDREFYTSIVYLEPFDLRNRQAFGYDMYSEPVRRAAMQQARDTGNAALSGKVELLQETGEDVQAGTLMYVPVYRAGAPLSTLPQRAAAITGWVYSPYRMADLMRGILNDRESFENRGIGIAIYDGTVSEAALLFSNQQADRSPDNEATGIEHIIDFNGTRWLLSFSQLPAYPNVDYSAAALALFGGSVSSILLFLLILSLSRTRNSAMQLAEKLTAEVREREEQLKASELRWRFALDGPGDGVWDWDIAANTVYYSRGWRNMLGITQITNSLQEWETRVHPDDLHHAKTVLQAYLEGCTQTYINEFRLRCEDGQYKWILDRGAIVSRDINNKPVRMIGSVSDFTTRKKMELALRRANADAEHFRAALDYVQSYIYIKDAQRRYTYANRATLELFGCDAQALAESTDEKFFPASTCRHIRQIDQRVLAGEKTREEVEVPLEKGQRIVYLEIKSPIYDDDEPASIVGILGISTDITHLKDHEAEMEKIAHFDALTGLPNRRLFADRLHQAMASAKRLGNKLAVAYLDLDGFKTVNDTHGHETGDRLLQALADRLRESIREGDTVARLGGDEFVVMLGGMQTLADIKPVVRRLLKAAADPFNIDGHCCEVSASLGISVFPQPRDTAEDQLLRQADQAMYKAKTSGKGCAYLFGTDGETDDASIIWFDLGDTTQS